MLNDSLDFEIPELAPSLFVYTRAHHIRVRSTVRSRKNTKEIPVNCGTEIGALANDRITVT